jgi:hypothetical protein
MVEPSVPILLIGYNRPNLLENQINILRKIKPSKMYIAIDGPKKNHGEDTHLVEEARKKVDLVDWECNLSTNFNIKNLGCAETVQSAISWAFTDNEFLIILEDDIEFNENFIKFCEKYLYQHSSNELFGSISGYQPINEELIKFEERLLCSKYFSGWGWATSREIWESYTTKNPKKINFSLFKIAQKYKFNILLILFESYNLYLIKKGKLDTWDYQFSYFLYINNKLNIYPDKNLIKNIGFNSSGTHTKSPIKSIVFIEHDIMAFQPNHMSINVNPKFDKFMRKKMTRDICNILKSKLLRKS